MIDRVLLAIYSIRIKSRKEREVIKLNDESHPDFLLLFEKYFSDILKLPQVLETIKDEEENEIPRKKLTLFNANTYRVSKEERYIKGSFYLGEGDSSVDVIDFESDEPLISETDKQKYGYYRRFFFFLQLPTSKKIGYIVIQKVGQHGMKGDFRKGFDLWFKKNGYSENYTFHLTQVNNTKLIERLIKEKPLKQFKLIRYKVPASTETTYKKNKKDSELDRNGTFEIVFKDPQGLNESYKDKLLTFATGMKATKTIELGNDIEQAFDDIQYSLVLNGKPKSFYLYKEIRMRSDRDVTNDVEYEDYKPTEESLIRVSKELIQDFSIPESNV